MAYLGLRRVALRGAGILSLTILTCAILTGTPHVASAPPTTGMIKIVEPNDGARIKGLETGTPVSVKVKVSNFTLQPQWSGKKPNAGHIHYWLDNFTDASVMPATTATIVSIFVPPGAHKIRGELVQDDHSSLADAYVGQIIREAPPDSKIFARRPTMDTITISVVR